MNLNTEDKKKVGYRASGLLGIPKDVVAIFFGLLICFSQDRMPGFALIALGVFGLFVDVHFLKMGKSRRNE